VRACSRKGPRSQPCCVRARFGEKGSALEQRRAHTVRFKLSQAPIRTPGHGANRLKTTTPICGSGSFEPPGDREAGRKSQESPLVYETLAGSDSPVASQIRRLSSRNGAEKRVSNVRGRGRS